MPWAHKWYTFLARTDKPPEINNQVNKQTRLTSHHPSLSVLLLTTSTISPTLMVSSSGLSASYSNVTLAFSTDFDEDDWGISVRERREGWGEREDGKGGRER